MKRESDARARPTQARRVIIVDPADNVATALTQLARGEVISVPNTDAHVELRADILFGHKFALRPIMAGREVVKYGVPIGVATGDIKEGDHVHVHNVATRRGRETGPTQATSTPRGEGPSAEAR